MNKTKNTYAFLITDINLVHKVNVNKMDSDKTINQLVVSLKMIRVENN